LKYPDVSLSFACSESDYSVGSTQDNNWIILFVRPINPFQYQCGDCGYLEVLVTKPDFSPEIPDFSRVEPEKNSIVFSSGSFAGAKGQHWKLRQGRPGRTGNFHVPPLHTWSEGHGGFKTNELTLSTAMPRDRRIAHPFSPPGRGPSSSNLKIAPVP
jgi:hypothetical protein